MSAVLAVVGVAIVVVTVVDALWTVLWSDAGAGPLSGAVTRAVARVERTVVGGHRRLRSAAGPVALVAIAALWGALLLVGLSLVVQAMPDGIRTSDTGRPAGATERIYYVGYTLFTLGNGGFSPHGFGAQLLTVAMTATGMVMITLAVSYLLPVVGASATSRSFASSVLALGDTPEEVVVAAWDGDRIALDHQLRAFSSELSVLAEQHLAYPVLHLFHSSQTASSAPLAVAVLDDVLLLLDAVDPRVAPSQPARRQLRTSIDRYARSFGAARSLGDEPPPPPSVAPLREAGIPVALDDDAVRHLGREHAERRRRVSSVLRVDGVTAPGASGDRRDG